MNTVFWIEADDRQWHLKKEADGTSRPTDGETTVAKRVTSTIGYHPRFGQALAAMHQSMLRDHVKVVGQDNIGAAIATSNELASRLHNVEPGEMVVESLLAGRIRG